MESFVRVGTGVLSRGLPNFILQTIHSTDDLIMPDVAADCMLDSRLSVWLSLHGVDRTFWTIG
jgi:hypothetical protein